MPISKFVEILDSADAPYSHENVSLEDVLEDKRHRSPSSGSTSSASSTSSANERPKIKSRVRSFSTKKSKS